MRSLILAVCLAATSFSAQASTIFADRVISYFEPTSFPTGADPFDGNANTTRRNAAYDGLPNGRDGGVEYERIDLKIGVTGSDTPITDGNSSTYLSLPDDSVVVLGFTNSFFFNGVGDDLFIQEIGNASETAELSISSDFGNTFTFVTTLNGNRVNRVDLEDFGIDETTFFNAVRLEGTSNGGSSPGFDLTYVEGLDGSIAVVPLPAALPLFLTGIGGLLAITRRRKIAAS